MGTDLPVKEKHHEPFMLSYRNRFLPCNFIGNSHDEIPVKSAMAKYSAEAVKFAEQFLLAAGYFNGNRPVEKPSVRKHYTSPYLTYGNGISITFDSERSHDGVDNCRLAVIDLDGERIYNGWRRLSSVDEILYCTAVDKDCKDALWYLV